jgi:hypothetical protein
MSNFSRCSGRPTDQYGTGDTAGLITEEIRVVHGYVGPEVLKLSKTNLSSRVIYSSKETRAFHMRSIVEILTLSFNILRSFLTTPGKWPNPIFQLDLVTSISKTKQSTTFWCYITLFGYRR